MENRLELAGKWSEQVQFMTSPQPKYEVVKASRMAMDPVLPSEEKKGISQGKSSYNRDKV